MIYRKLYLGLGVFFSLSTILLLSFSVFSKTSDLGMAFLSQLSLALISLTMWHLYPEMKENDERIKNIKRKMLSILSVTLTVLILILFTWMTFFELPFKASDVLNIVLFLIVLVATSTLVFLSKRY
ncbi:hypothetical protein [Exiguobacterium marinum]|uniref:hypothetical protein n=1 Tax=Exiguobacterium marinum TaxID=273528 RepID=UPI00047C9837|nr:hypothetical protein [Exiguobacterium marinum]